MNTHEIIKAIRQGLDSKATKLLELNYDNISLNHKIKIFKESIKYGLHHTSKMLLSDMGIDPTYDDNHAIQWACENNNAKIVELLLSYDGVECTSLIVDPSANKDCALILASEGGFTKIMKMLLSDERTNPNVYDDYVFDGACDDGHSEIVKM